MKSLNEKCAVQYMKNGNSLRNKNKIKGCITQYENNKDRH